MDYARLDGEILRAWDPEYDFRSWTVRRKLRCPTCDEPVTFASGPYQAPHFRHKPGMATFECENFHPSTHIPAPQPVKPDPWRNVQHCHDPLPPPERRRDSWSLDLQVSVELKNRSRANFVFEARARNFVESASIEICSIHGGSRTVVLGKETKTLAMLVNPFKPFFKVHSDDKTVQLEVSRFCDFFEAHRYFVITNNLTLQIDEEFGLGDIKAVYDAKSEQVMMDLNTRTILRLLSNDGYIQSFEEVAVKVSSIDCIGLNSEQRCLFLSSFEHIVADNESEHEMKLEVKALANGGAKLFEGFFELDRGRHNLNMPEKDQAVAYLVKSGRVIIRLELKEVEAITEATVPAREDFGNSRSFIVGIDNRTQRVSWNGHSWVYSESVELSNNIYRERAFPVSKKEWNLEILGMDFD